MPKSIKVTFNEEGNIAASGLKTATLIQNSGDFNYVYIYGLEAGLSVKISYIRPDGFPIGPFAGTYGYDPEEVYCVYGRIPKEALAVAGGLFVSIVAEKDITETVEGVTTTTTVIQAFADVVATIAVNRSVVGL